MYQVEIYDLLNQNSYITSVESKTKRDAGYDAIQKVCQVKGFQPKEYLVVRSVSEVI